MRLIYEKVTLFSIFIFHIIYEKNELNFELKKIKY